MLLRTKHLYKIWLPNVLSRKKYVLIAPSKPFDTDNLPDDFGFYISCVACIDVGDNMCYSTSIYFSSKGNCIFEHPSVSDVIEMTRRLKKEGDNFRYDLKSGEIKRKKQVFEL